MAWRFFLVSCPHRRSSTPTLRISSVTQRSVQGRNWKLVKRGYRCSKTFSPRLSQTVYPFSYYLSPPHHTHVLLGGLAVARAAHAEVAVGRPRHVRTASAHSSLSLSLREVLTHPQRTRRRRVPELQTTLPRTLLLRNRTFHHSNARKHDVTPRRTPTQTVTWLVRHRIYPR